MTVSIDKASSSREIEPAQVLAPKRIIALLLMAVLAGGLAYLRFGPDSGSVSVSEGAKAGDLILKRCDYATEAGPREADCGTLVVPENRADPRSRLIALPVTRVRATADHPAEPIFRLEGGPGITNMTFPNASRFADDRDVVLVGYRGVDGSSVLDCSEVESALKHSTDFLAEESFRAYADGFRDCAKRLTDDRVDLAGYSLAQRVDDLEAARVALGYDRINLMSESVGTRTAMIYSWRYPDSIHRSVMIGVNPPGHFLWDPQTTDEQIRHYSDLCSRDTACSGRTDDLAASMRRTAADVPDRWLFLPIEDGNVLTASFYGLMETTQESAPLNAPITLNTWLSAAGGDPSGFWLQSLLAGLFFPTSFVWGDVAAIALQDADTADAYYASGGDHGSILGNPGTDFNWGGGRLADAWPANPSHSEYDRVQTSTVDTLLIGGTVDFSTPATNATSELLPHLPNGHQVVLAEFGHSASFWADQSEAGSRLINTFLDSGQVDDSLYKSQSVDFTPEVTQTALAKGIAGSMVGLALVAVLSLLWMPWRVHKRGAFGGRVSTALRSVYPIVLGLGGWFLGALIVLTALPSVPLDDELLAAFGVGLPIGLGVYFAWVNSTWSATTRATGLAAAVGGALIGAWLGFNATKGLVALITTIVAATIGANLVLLALDIAWDLQRRDRFIAAQTGGMPEAISSTSSSA